MSKQYYEPGKAAWVTIDNCAGNLLVKSWSDSRIGVQGEHTAEQAEGMLTLSSKGSLIVWLPHGTSLAVNNVHGDTVVKGITGELQLETIASDLVLKTVGAGGATVGTVHGNMAVRGVGGPLHIGAVSGELTCRSVVGGLRVDSVHGDLSARYAEGDVELGEVFGDIDLQTVNGDVQVAMAHGDVKLGNLGGLLNVKQCAGEILLRGDLIAGKHHLTADGDVVIRWPAGSALSLQATAATISTKLALDEMEERTDEESGRQVVSGKIGDGEAVLIVDTGGRVVLKEAGQSELDKDFETSWMSDAIGAAVDLSALPEHISSEIVSRMNELTARMEERFTGDYAQRMAEKAARKAERAVARAARQVAREQRRATHWHGPPAPPPPPPPRQRRQQPSAEEQVKILSMLEKGIISVEEAETLLSALEN